MDDKTLESLGFESLFDEIIATEGIIKKIKRKMSEKPIFVDQDTYMNKILPGLTRIFELMDKDVKELLNDPRLTGVSTVVELYPLQSPYRIMNKADGQYIGVVKYDTSKTKDQEILKKFDIFKRELNSIMYSNVNKVFPKYIKYYNYYDSRNDDGNDPETKIYSKDTGVIKIHLEVLVKFPRVFESLFSDILEPANEGIIDDIKLKADSKKQGLSYDESVKNISTIINTNKKSTGFTFIKTSDSASKETKELLQKKLIKLTDQGFKAEFKTISDVDCVIKHQYNSDNINKFYCYIRLNSDNSIILMEDNPKNLIKK